MSTSSSPDSTYTRAVDLKPYLNNKGTSHHGESDGTGLAKGATLPADFLPRGQWRHDGVEFELPSWEGEMDNVRADGQIITLSGEEVAAIHVLGVGDDPRGEPLLWRS